MNGKAMKRSEMIHSIEILLETIGYKGPSTSGEEVVDLIEAFGMLPPSTMNPRAVGVDLIEALGMLPPKTMNPESVGLNYIAMVHSGIGATVNAWEPEDSVLT